MAKTSAGAAWLMRMLLVALCAAAFLGAVNAADPDPLQDFCVADLSANAPLVNGFPCKPRSTVTAEDFVFKGLRNPSAPLDQIAQTSLGAAAVIATPQTWPGINTQGVTHARLDFAVGGVFPLHTHPRAAETLLVLKGSVYTGFVSDDNVLYAATLQQGDVILFPRGLLHFQLNAGNETAITFNTLTSQSPGFLFPANQIFQTNITSAVIEKSFGVDAATVKKITASVSNVN